MTLFSKLKCVYNFFVIETKKNFLIFLLLSRGIIQKNIVFGVTEAGARRCSVTKVFLEISQNSQENACAKGVNFIKKETLAQEFSCELCEISRNMFSYRTLPVAASGVTCSKRIRKSRSKAGERFQNRCFPVIIAKFLRTAFFIKHLWWLLLKNIFHNMHF